jgi:hypothetical protein
MKTAMQELIDWLDVKIEILENEYSMSIASGIRAAKMEAEKLLEKEKEQIIEAYDRGYKACDLDEALEINKTMFSGERYYEQTYNK